MKLSYINDLYRKLEKKIEIVKSPSTKSSQSILAEILSAVAEALGQIKSHILEKGFESEEEEILFFKELKPKFYSLSIYYNEEHNIINALPQDTLKVQRDYYQKELEYIHRHFEQQSFLYGYFKRGETSMDLKYFTRAFNSIFDLATGIADREFSTREDYAFSKFIAFENLRAVILRKLKSIDIELQAPLIRASEVKILQWTDSKVHLVELVYALYLSGSINDGKADLCDIVAWLEQSLNISLDDYNRKFIDISRRKLTRKANYIESLRDAVEEFIDNNSRYGSGQKVK
ncbi:RteC domain-containing protein [Pedobacter aquatilis]|uniref:RteC domain-containing protein n=1 Tax=Pedobacter aquatilis TaxID=351343 RepID=UPI0029303F1D|nr:RteC domain-containing protein [Pedobacter aquatilis]